MSHHRGVFTPRRATQVALWTLVAVLVGLAGWVLTQPPAPGPTGARYAAVATAPAPDAVGPVLHAGDLHAAGGGSADPVRDPKILRSEARDPKQWLPAYRWGGWYGMDTAPVSVWELGDTIGNKISSGLASLLFSFAGLFWSALLWIISLAFDLNVVEDRATWVNQRSAAIGRAMGSSGLVAIAALLVIVTVGSAVLKSGGRGNNGALRNVALFLAPIALMQLMIGNAGANPNGAAGQLTPAGLAITGSEVLNDIGDKVATPLTKMSSVETYDKADTSAPSCSWYYARMYATFDKVTAEKKSRGQGADVADVGVAIKLVSRLWESTQLRSFTEAQYGNVREGRYAVCHLLERNRGTATATQAALAGGDGSPYRGLALRDPDGEDGTKQSVFADPPGTSARFAANWAWMACRNLDATSDEQMAWPNAAKGDRLDPKDCEAWAEGNWDEDSFSAVGGEPLQYDDAEHAAKELGGTSTKEYKVVNAYLGTNADQRFVLGLISVATAALYLVALGALSLGTAVATVLFAFLLVLAPVTLLLLALPGKNGRRNATGLKLLRMTGTTMAAKLTLYLFLLATIALIDLLNSLAGG